MPYGPDLPLVIVEAVRSNPAVPAEWICRTASGRVALITYGMGILSLAVGDDLTEAMVGPSLVREDYGNMYDGWMDWDELKRRLPGWVVLPAREGALDG